MIPHSQLPCNSLYIVFGPGLGKEASISLQKGSKSRPPKRRTCHRKTEKSPMGQSFQTPLLGFCFHVRLQGEVPQNSRAPKALTLVCWGVERQGSIAMKHLFELILCNIIYSNQKPSPHQRTNSQIEILKSNKSWIHMQIPKGFKMS